MKFCSKMGRRAAEFIFGAAVMCFGMSVFGMQENGRHADEKFTAATKFREPNSSDELAKKYFKGDIDSGYAAWEEDLFDLASEEFKNRMNSSNATERSKAHDKLRGWSYVTLLRITYELPWWDNEEDKECAKEALEEAKRLAEQNGNETTAEEIKGILGSLQMRLSL